MNTATPLGALEAIVPEKNTIRMEHAVLHDFCNRIKDQPQGKATTSPQCKKVARMHLALDGLLKATFEDDFYDRFDYFFKEDIVYIFQGKKFAHHVIYSTKSKSYYVLKDGIYRIFKFVGLSDTPPTSQRPNSRQVNQDQAK